MAAEYLAAKEEALGKLGSSCVSNLRRFQEDDIEAEFSFSDHWGDYKQDESTHPKFPILNLLSKLILNFDTLTWVTYTYKNGTLSAELFQNVKGAKSVQLHETISVEDIPFNTFSEDDLIKAAQRIEKHLLRKKVLRS